jgi:hypothetical protein
MGPRKPARRARQAVMVPQHRALVFPPEHAAPLQQGHDVLDEVREAARQPPDMTLTNISQFIVIL